MIANLTAEYCDKIDISHRKEFAQFFTPPVVARLMAEWVLKDGRKNILDPAFGLGIFFEESKELRHDISFTTFEIDSNILKYYKSSIDVLPTNLHIINQDYLLACPNKYEGIICNPPYLRFQKFINRHAVMPVLKSYLGEDIVGYSNIASIFLLKSIHELKENGRLAYIMPYEFMNTGYGKKIKKALLENGLLKHAIIFKNENEIFTDATTTVVVLLCEKDYSSTDVSFITIRSLDQCLSLEHVLMQEKQIYPRNYLSELEKWSPLFASESISINKDLLVPLSNYGSFKRGIATGANEFFSFSKSTIQELGLPKSSYRKCITRSPQLKTSLLTESQMEKLIESDAPVFVLDVKDPSNPNVLKYIKQGEANGFHERYLTRMRKPWYRLEDREPAPILFGVFSRGEYKVVRNYTDALNLTCFHGFFPNMFGAAYLDLIYLYFLSDSGGMILKQNQRKYGSDLDKFEPNDLNKSLVPSDSFLDNLKSNYAVPEITKYVLYSGTYKDKINSLFQILVSK